MIEIVVKAAVTELSIAMTNVETFLEKPDNEKLLLTAQSNINKSANLLTFIEFNAPAKIARTIYQYITDLIDENTVFTETHWSALIDAFTGLEVCLENYLEESTLNKNSLDYSRQALKRLLSSKSQKPAQKQSLKQPLVKKDNADELTLEKALNVAEITRQTKELESMDATLFDIFKCEVSEGFAVVQAQYLIWKQEPENGNALESFRRALHTIKGCGYVAGAKFLGDKVKSIEKMITRLLEKQQPISSDLLEPLDDSIIKLSTLISDLFDNNSAPKEQESVKKESTKSKQPKHSTKTKKAKPKTKNKATKIFTKNKTVKIPVSEESSLDKTKSAIIPVHMDESLAKIFIPEAQFHIQTISRFIEQARPSSSKVPDSLLKALHTLHGSSHLAEVEFMARISGSMESYCNHLSKLSGKFEEDNLSLLEKFVTVMTESINAINVPEANIPDWNTLLEDIQLADKAFLDSTSKEFEPTKNELEDTSVQRFLSNSVNLSTQLNQYFAVWKTTANDPLAMNNLIDTLRKFKQNAAAAELTYLVDLVDVIESLLEILPATDDEKIVLVGEGLEQLEDIMDNLYLSLMPPDVRTITGKLQNAFEQSLSLQVEAEFVNLGIDSGYQKQRPEKIDDVPEQTKAIKTFKSTDSVLEDELNVEMLGIFLDEADQLIEQLDEAHSSWLLDTSSKESIETQMRHLHTFKGGARLVGLSDLGDLSHFLEELFEALIFNRLDCSERILKLIRDGFDALQKSVEMLHKNQSPPELNSIVKALKAGAKNEDWDDSALFKGSNAPLTVASEAPVKSSTEENFSTSQNELLNLVRSDALPPSLETDAVAMSEEKRIRVSSGLLDKLINDAGDITISQSRLDKQNATTKYNLLELRNTIERLKRQLNVLNLETETQIISRHKDETQEHQDKVFDPLEMDRYSTLQQVSRALSETVNDLSEIGDTFDRTSEDTDSLMLKVSRTAHDLKNGLMDTRMVPFKVVQARFKRVVRETAQDTGKKAVLEVEGTDKQIDHTILDKMIAPIEHLLRNAVTHGIESPKLRDKTKKPKQGKVLLSFDQKYSSVKIIVQDDGAGLDIEAIRKTATTMGLLETDSEVTIDELYSFILNPGFSTASEVSQVAGRGIGMNVVKNEIQQLGGSISITSVPGKGTSFIIWIPLVFSITEALLVKAANEVYAIPHGNADNIIQVPVKEIMANSGRENPSIEYAGRRYTLSYLGEMLGLPEQRPKYASNWVPILLVRTENRAVAIQVDEAIGTSQIMVKSIGEQFKQIPWFIDGTLLSNGKIAILLDAKALVRSDRKLQAPTLTHSQKETVPTIMIVDDSLTVRKVTSRIFERLKMNVLTARDGVEAIELLQNTKPDIMLLDIEMPRMNGYELAQQMMHSEELKNIPIIMITSRSGEKHRKRALELGVKHHLGKPFKEAELLGHVDALLKGNING